LLGVHCGTQVNDSGNDGPNVVMEMSAAGRSAYGGNVSNQVIWAWVNAPGLDQPVERIAFINGEARQRQVFHADGLGSIATLTDESGATVQTYTYAAFGSIRTQTGTDLNRITYTAREAMGDSLGFFYYRHRIYDPTTGRFTSEDPLGFVDGANRYVYCGNKPINSIDPKGQWGIPGAIYGGIVGAVSGAITGYALDGRWGAAVGGLVGGVVGVAVGLVAPQASSTAGSLAMAALTGAGASAFSQQIVGISQGQSWSEAAGNVNWWMVGGASAGGVMSYGVNAAFMAQISVETQAITGSGSILQAMSSVGEGIMGAGMELTGGLIGQLFSQAQQVEGSCK
jgi:RHS repeat-associated protein